MEPPRSRAPSSPSLPASFPRALLTCRPRVTTGADEARVAAIVGANGARSAPLLPRIEPAWPPSPPLTLARTAAKQGHRVVVVLDKAEGSWEPETMAYKKRKACSASNIRMRWTVPTSAAFCMDEDGSIDPTNLQEQEIIDDLGDHLVVEMQSLVDVLQGFSSVERISVCVSPIWSCCGHRRSDG